MSKYDLHIPTWKILFSFFIAYSTPPPVLVPQLTKRIPKVFKLDPIVVYKGKLWLIVMEIIQMGKNVLYIISIYAFLHIEVSTHNYK